MHSLILVCARCPITDDNICTPSGFSPPHKDEVVRWLQRKRNGTEETEITARGEILVLQRTNSPFQESYTLQEAKQRWKQFIFTFCSAWKLFNDVSACVSCWRQSKKNIFHIAKQWQRDHIGQLGIIHTAICYIRIMKQKVVLMRTYLNKVKKKLMDGYSLLA